MSVWHIWNMASLNGVDLGVQLQVKSKTGHFGVIQDFTQIAPNGTGTITVSAAGQAVRIKFRGGDGKKMPGTWTSEVEVNAYGASQAKLPFKIECGRLGLPVIAMLSYTPNQY